MYLFLVGTRSYANTPNSDLGLFVDAVNNAQGPLLLEIDKPAGEELGVTLNVEEVTDTSIDDQTAAVKRYYVIGAIGAASIADRYAPGKPVGIR